MNACPSCEQLPLLINGELSAASHQELEEHVESCLDCQRELENLTSEDLVAAFIQTSGQNGHSDSTMNPQFVERLLREGPRSDDAAAVTDDCKQPVALPEQIGDYRIVREIGRGGMGIIFEAEQYSLKRRVALKVLPQLSLLDSSFRERFQNEARAAAQMHHANIVPVFEVGNADGHYFYAMQLIQGRSLDYVIKQQRDRRNYSQRGNLSNGSVAEPPAADQVQTNGHKPLKLDALSGRWDDSSSNAGYRQHCHTIAKIALQVAQALAYAHERGVIHRDIKPSNLILDADGDVWVTDFGLAKTSDEGMTQTGDFLGTLRYMSPERFSGICDPQTDIYALGITLYELLMLRPAFDQSDRLQLIDSIHKVNPPKPRSIDRRIPIDLETIILKSCDKQPQERYNNAAELADDLERFLNDEPIKARLASWPERVMRWLRRNRGWGFALLGAALLSIALPLSGIFRAEIPPATSTGPAGFPSKQAHLHATEEVREIAKTLLTRGASILATTSEGTVAMKAPSHVPSGYFQIGVVDLTSAESLEDSIALLKQLPELSELWLKDASLTEAMIKEIAEARSLEAIELSGSDIDDAGIDHFIGMPRLRELSVPRTQVTSNAVRRFKGLDPKVSIRWEGDR